MGNVSDHWICTKCGKDNRKGKFCIQCGTQKTIEGWCCSKCGKPDNKGKFCIVCGEPKFTEDTNGTAANGIGQTDTEDVVRSAKSDLPRGKLSSPENSQAVSRSMSKRNKGILAAIILLAAAYFSYGMIMEKLYDSRCDTFISISADVSKTIENMADLTGDADAEETKRIADQLEAQAKELGSLYDSLKGMTPPESMKNQHEKLLTVIEKDKEVLLKAVEILRYNERLFSQKEQKAYGDLYQAYHSAMQKLVASESGIIVKGKDIKTILVCDVFERNMKSYADKKLVLDRQYFAAKMKEYQEQLRNANTAAKTKNEVVFLTENVQKAGKDLLVYGRFYNGTADVVSGIKEMLVDITLNEYDKEILSIKDFAYNDTHLGGMMIQPQGSSWPIMLKLTGQAPDEAYNHFTVDVHKIHWSVRRPVKR